MIWRLSVHWSRDRCQDRVKPIGQRHDPRDRAAALELALKWGDEIPIGVLYRGGRASFEANQPALAKATLCEQFAASGPPARSA